ncbi:Dual specificity protein phosphatase 10 [Mortierella sp. AD011]|nr:Dual specificity protein phosphatase 10 [Mortierella sp. AD010]KAF9403764.1 Dual specificity protein phosphatase 10 [Mortierella sp. AD011]
MSHHSLCTASSETSYLVPSTPSTPSLHRPLLAQDIKKVRNAKQLSLKVLPSPSSSSISSNGDNDNTIAPSPSFPPSSTSLSSRRPFTPTPLLSASLKTSAAPSTPCTPSFSASTSKRRSQLLLDDALPTPRLPLPTTASHRSISAYFSDYSLECGAASPYTTEPVCVLPNLYLGAEHNASDIRTLQRLGITFVLNVAIEIAQVEKGSSASMSMEKMNEKAGETVRGGVQFKSLAWTHHQKNLLQDFPAAFALIDEAIARNNGNGKALVHCQLGVSRSASLVIAYVMRSLGMGLTEAYDFVKERSGVISPNMSLMYQLSEYEKSLKNPGNSTSITESSDASSTRSRNSWCSQMDDDEPPYPFSAAFADAENDDDLAAPRVDVGTSQMDDSFLPPATPIRQEFYKRPLTPDSVVDHPNTKPFQSPSRLAQPKSFLSSRRASHLSRLGYQRSPLTSFSSSSSCSIASDCRTPVEASFPLPKTPTTENFSSLSLEMESTNATTTSTCDAEMMVPPTPFLRSSFSIPSLSSSTSSYASSVSSFEACHRPSISSLSSSTSTYFTACDDDDIIEDGPGAGVYSPRNSGNWSCLPSTSMSTSSQSVIAVTHEEVLKPEVKKKKMNPLWSGLKALQVVADAYSASSSSSSSFITTATPESSTMPLSSATAVVTAEPAPVAAATSTPVTSTSTSAPTSTNATTTTMALTKSKLPDFIFSPRTYHESRSFGDFYHALCMEG